MPLTLLREQGLVMLSEVTLAVVQQWNVDRNHGQTVKQVVSKPPSRTACARLRNADCILVGSRELRLQRNCQAVWPRRSWPEPTAQWKWYGPGVSLMPTSPVLSDTKLK